jgi:ankyrin repeat protein
LQIVDSLIAAGAEVNPTGGFSRFPLAHAVEKRSTTMVDALLARGADVNFKNPTGITALILAALSLSPAMVKYLISKGADAKAQTREGETALSLINSFKLIPSSAKPNNPFNRSGISLAFIENFGCYSMILPARLIRAFGLSLIIL